MPRSGNVLIGPSPLAMRPLIICGLKNRSSLQVVHGVVGVIGRRMATRRIAALPKNTSWPRISDAVAFFGSSLPNNVELGRRREVEDLLELGHEMDLAAPFQNIDSFLCGDHRVAVEVGRRAVRTR